MLNSRKVVGYATDSEGYVFLSIILAFLAKKSYAKRIKIYLDRVW